ncbi:homoserine kinase [Jeotgalibacillus sp. R-1-5s-1]|uniref:homoserine kinase n=1 Tax=Jeotgalibacillus sp. R-1-5s-1 TaxID=2555897 RepID=UPI00141B341B|nr:homoserine kinase [Jeotgalibacillus sp. R-1-5s-1]
MSFKPFSVVAPASTANLGPGYDSLGLALPIYQTVKIEPSDSWRVEYVQPEHQTLPGDEKNLIIKTVRHVEKKFNKTCPPAKLMVESDIPLSRGLGSSAAAISSGISIADQLLNLSLSQEEKIYLACEMEGHPDNVSASIAGGFTVSRYANGNLDTISVPVNGFSVIVLVPLTTLETKESREVIPKILDHRDAAMSSAAGNVLVASLLTGDFDKAGRAMMVDKFHEPHRSRFFPDLPDIKKTALAEGAFAVTISGAGPSIAVYAENVSAGHVASELENKFKSYTIHNLLPSDKGTVLYEKNENHLFA